MQETVALAVIPEPAELELEHIDQVAEQALALIESAETIDDATELKARMAALESYMRRRNPQLSRPLQRATRRAESRIGELLPPPHPGERTDLEPSPRVGKVEHHDAERFRLVAKYLRYWWPEHEGGWSRREILRIIQRQRLIEATARIRNGHVAESCKVFQGDIRSGLPELEPGCADVIVTDPPYPAEYLPLYEDLARLAVRVLRPGGSVFVMVGQSYLPNVLGLMLQHLNYHWTIAYLTPGGQSVQLWQRSINTFWKPVLWLTTGEYTGSWRGDVVSSATNDNDKDFHEWGQSESGMAALVNKFTEPGQTILDPFVGGGTTGVVALGLGRRFIGVDSDPDAVAVTRKRLGLV